MTLEFSNPDTRIPFEKLICSTLYADSDGEVFFIPENNSDDVINLVYLCTDGTMFILSGTKDELPFEVTSDTYNLYQGCITFYNGDII